MSVRGSKDQNRYESIQWTDPSCKVDGKASQLVGLSQLICQMVGWKIVPMCAFLAHFTERFMFSSSLFFA